MGLLSILRSSSETLIKGNNLWICNWMVVWNRKYTCTYKIIW